VSLVCCERLAVKFGANDAKFEMPDAVRSAGPKG
jgi:hypothetical protein